MSNDRRKRGPKASEDQGPTPEVEQIFGVQEGQEDRDRVEPIPTFDDLRVGDSTPIGIVQEIAHKGSQKEIGPLTNRKKWYTAVAYRQACEESKE
jgi:hypothetical protein